MNVLRDNRESLLAVLEAFVYDPLINWRLMPNTEDKRLAGASCCHLISVDCLTDLCRERSKSAGRAYPGDSLSPGSHAQSQGGRERDPQGSVLAPFHHQCRILTVYCRGAREPRRPRTCRIPPCRSQAHWTRLQSRHAPYRRTTGGEAHSASHLAREPLPVLLWLVRFLVEYSGRQSPLERFLCFHRFRVISSDICLSSMNHCLL